MRYSLITQQPKAIEWKFSLSECFLFAFLFEVPTWAESTEIEGVIFYHCSRFKVLEELPILTDKADTVYRLFKDLDEKGVIQYRKLDGRDYVKITKKGATWNKYNSEKNPSSENHSEKNPSELGKKSENHSEKNPTDYNIRIDKVISDKDAPNGAPPKKPKKEKLSKDGNLIKAMASDFDVAFSYLSGTSKNLCWGAAATEKIRWSGKEIGNIANLRDALQKRMKEKQVDPTDKDTLENWRMFLQMSIDLKDDFLNRNFTPSFLYSQFNSIILKLNQQKNGKHNGSTKDIFPESTQRAVLQELFDEGFFNNGGKS